MYLRTTVSLTPEMLRAVEEYMRRNGITSYAELFRELIRRCIIPALALG